METCDCNDSFCDEIDKVLADQDEGISKAAHEIHIMKFKKKILESLNEYQ